MPIIEAYDFGYIVVDGHTYRSDVIVFPEGVKANWWRREGHCLYPDDLPFLNERRPKLLIIGQGKYGRMTISTEMQEWLTHLGIKWFADITDKAVQRFGTAQQEYPDGVIGAFHLTC